MKLKDACSLRQHVQKQRHYSADKGPYNQSYGFSNGQVWTWGLDHKEGWTLKNWCFWTVVLEKTLESPLDCKDSNMSLLKEISPEYSLEGLMLKLKLQYFGHLIGRTDSFEKTLICGKIEGRRRREWQRTRWLDGITDSMDIVWASSGRWWRAGKAGVLQSMGSQRVIHSWATEQQQMSVHVCVHLFKYLCKQKKKSLNTSNQLSLRAMTCTDKENMLKFILCNIAMNLIFSLFCISFKKSYCLILKFYKNIVRCPKLPCFRPTSTGILLQGDYCWVLIISLECIAWVEAWLFLDCLLDPKTLPPDTRKRIVLWICGKCLDFHCWSVSLGFSLFYTYCFCRQESESTRCGFLGTGSNCCPSGCNTHCI